MSRCSKVFAFEPNPYPLVPYVVDDNVEIVPIAVGNLDGITQLRIPKNRKGWSSNGASITNVELNQGIEYDVSIHKIDTLKIENIGLIKIDVEGAELEVLNGALNTLNAQKPNLIIENELVHSDKPEILFKFMKKINYNAFYVDENKDLKKLEDNFDVLKNQNKPANKRFGYIQNFIFMHDERL